MEGSVDMISNKLGAIGQFFFDKETILEGYVSEYLFEKQFLDNKNKDYTHGIWIAQLFKDKKNNDEAANFFFIFKQELSNFDKKLLSNTDLKKSFMCFHAYEKDNQWWFSDGVKTFNQKEFLQRIKNNRIPKPIDEHEHEHQMTNRKEKCIDFFEEQNILLKIANERHFANDFLSVYFDSVVNIDYLACGDGGELDIYEVKFKNESKAGYFGINVGQQKVLKRLSCCNFNIYYVVLYKDKKYSSFHIFDYINASDVPKKWYIGKIDIDNYVGHGTAPDDTSINGDHPQSHYNYDKSPILDKGECYELIMP